MIDKLRSRLVYLGAFRFATSHPDKLRVLVASLIIQVPKGIRNRARFIDALASWVIRGVQMEGLGALFYIDALNNLKHIQTFYEAEIQDWFKIREDEIFVDIGANIGRYTVTLAKQCKKVYAFEPFPPTHRYLVRNIFANDLYNVEEYQVALWDKEETVTFHVKNSSGINSVVESERTIYKIEVPAAPLDYFELDGMDLVKIDVEGAEREVLKGMTDSISIFHPRIIIESKLKNIVWISMFLASHGYTLAESDLKPTYANLFFTPQR